MVGVVAEMISSFDVLELEAKIQRGKLDAMVARVRSVLDSIDMEVAFMEIAYNCRSLLRSSSELVIVSGD